MAIPQSVYSPTVNACFQFHIMNLDTSSSKDNVFHFFFQLTYRSGKADPMICLFNLNYKKL